MLSSLELELKRKCQRSCGWPHVGSGCACSYKTKNGQSSVPNVKWSIHACPWLRRSSSESTTSTCQSVQYSSKDDVFPLRYMLNILQYPNKLMAHGWASGQCIITIPNFHPCKFSEHLRSLLWLIGVNLSGCQTVRHMPQESTHNKAIGYSLLSRRSVIGAVAFAVCSLNRPRLWTTSRTLVLALCHNRCAAMFVLTPLICDFENSAHRDVPGLDRRLNSCVVLYES